MEASTDPHESLLALNDVASSTRDLFTTSGDIGTIAEIQSILQSHENAKAAALDEQRDILRALSRQLEAQRTAAQRPAAAPTEKQHQQKMQTLDSTKFSLAKNIASLEQDLALTESGLESTRQEAARAEKQAAVEQETMQNDVNVWVS